MNFKDLLLINFKYSIIALTKHKHIYDVKQS